MAFSLLAARCRNKGGCVIGNLSVALADTHEAFRRRLAECFDEMAREFKPYLEAASQKHCPRRQIDTWDLARYIVAIIEGSIMLTRTHRDARMMERQFEYLKEHLRKALGG
jgi:TetR/AcrR family transcriptional repressor of nem operon